jgi:hypothetical protein
MISTESWLQCEKASNSSLEHSLWFFRLSSYISSSLSIMGITNAVGSSIICMRGTRTGRQHCAAHCLVFFFILAAKGLGKTVRYSSHASDPLSLSRVVGSGGGSALPSSEI